MCATAWITMGMIWSDELERAVVVSGPQAEDMQRRTLIDHIPGINNFIDVTEAPTMHGGHANVRGLNDYGIILLEEMMARGFIIDVDHMSEKSTEYSAYPG